MNNFHQLAQIINTINNSLTALSQTVADTRQKLNALQQQSGLNTEQVLDLIKQNQPTTQGLTQEQVLDLIKQNQPTTQGLTQEQVIPLINNSTESFVNTIKNLIAESEFSDAQIEQIKNIVSSEIQLDVPLANIIVPTSIDIDDNIIIGQPKPQRKTRTPRAKSPSIPIELNIE